MIISFYHPQSSVVFENSSRAVQLKKGWVNKENAATFFMNSVDIKMHRNLVQRNGKSLWRQRVIPVLLKRYLIFIITCTTSIRVKKVKKKLFSFPLVLHGSLWFPEFFNFRFSKRLFPKT